jgi:hypothetical protein
MYTIDFEVLVKIKEIKSVERVIISNKELVLIGVDFGCVKKG